MAYKGKWVTESSSYFDKMSQIESLNKTRLKKRDSKNDLLYIVPSTGKSFQSHNCF